MLWLFLAALVLTSGMANIQTGTRLTATPWCSGWWATNRRSCPICPSSSSARPAIPCSPCRPTLHKAWPTPGSSRKLCGWRRQRSPLVSQSAKQARPSEQALLPPQPLRFSQVFFKNYDLAPQGGLFRGHHRRHAAHRLRLVFAGLFISGRTLALLYPPPVGYSLPPLLARPWSSCTTC